MKFVLHHIPKTGGHSIVQSFRAVFGPDAVSIDKGDTPLVSTHLPATELFEVYPDRTHITILRSPADRIRSYVRYMRTVTDTPVGDQARSLPASQFLQLDSEPIRRFTDNRQTFQLGSDAYGETFPQTARALERLERMAWVGHTETLTEDLDQLFELVGEPNPRLLPQNVSQDAWVDDLDNWRKFEDLYRWDRRLLNLWDIRCQ